MAESTLTKKRAAWRIKLEPRLEEPSTKHSLLVTLSVLLFSAVLCVLCSALRFLAAEDNKRLNQLVLVHNLSRLCVRDAHPAQDAPAPNECAGNPRVRGDVEKRPARHDKKIADDSERGGGEQQNDCRAQKDQRFAYEMPLPGVPEDDTCRHSKRDQGKSADKNKMQAGDALPWPEHREKQAEEQQNDGKLQCSRNRDPPRRRLMERDFNREKCALSLIHI